MLAHGKEIKLESENRWNTKRGKGMLLRVGIPLTFAHTHCVVRMTYSFRLTSGFQLRAERERERLERKIISTSRTEKKMEEKFRAGFLRLCLGGGGGIRTTCSRLGWPGLGGALFYFRSLFFRVVVARLLLRASRHLVERISFRLRSICLSVCLLASKSPLPHLRPKRGKSGFDSIFAPPSPLPSLLARSKL